MRIARYACIAACLWLALAASAADRRETRSLPSFKAIGVSAPIRVELTQGDADSLVVEGDEEALAQLETFVENGALKLRQKTRERVPKLDRVKAYVTARNIESLSISGSGYIGSPAIRAADLQVSISGSGDLRIGQLTARKLDLSVSGSGDIHVAGTADSVSASITGSGDVKAAKLQAGEVSVSIAGSGAATLWVRDKLSARIAGSGDLRYYGDPPYVSKSIAGSGSVKRAGATPS
ncbi:MAG TPA: head GIN domain-containing protein [Usitatibacter sp.]|nr:head GIN domain-containing protein [Usitatibacter sp.]